MLDRRSALRAISITVGTLLYAGCAPQREASLRNNNDLDVCIIGAGIAGLGAGQVLQQAGINPIILEARDRIGGRIWTERQQFIAPVDYGAAWIHGINNNPLTEIADTSSIERVPSPYREVVVYAEDGLALEDRALTEASALLRNILSDAEDYGEELNNDVPLQAGIDAVLTERDLTTEQLRLLNLAVQYEIETEYAADTNDLSLWWWNAGSEFSGRDDLLPGGYDQLIMPLAEGLDVRLGYAVNEIDYSGDRVTILTNTGEFTANHVIVTLPLGVLKERTVQFRPELPAEKLTAIDRLAMGTLDKLTLEFDAVFWDDVEFITYAGVPADNWSSILNLDYFFDLPILQMLIGADAAVAMEQQANEQVLASGLAVLQTIYGPDVPEPLNYNFTRWHTDPYSFGSYSSLGVGAEPRDYDRMASTIGSKLFFAGEATDRNYYQTAHGALRSGRRAAREILAL